MRNLCDHLSLRQFRSSVLLILLFQSVAVYGQPAITTFTPEYGAPGTIITIHGSNFSAVAAENSVYFGPVKGTVTAASTTQLTVTVPAGVTHTPISVIVGGLVGYAAKPFGMTFTGGDIGFHEGSFEAPKSVTSGTQPHRICLGDFDGDGKTDMATVHVSPGSFFAYVTRNTSTPGNISFAASTDIATNQYPYIPTAGDLDGDGKLDLAIIYYNDPIVSVYRNTSTPGNISFAPKVDYTTGWAPADVKIGDLNNDGKPELVVTSRLDLSIDIFKNNSTIGNLSFAPKVGYGVNGTAGYLALGDLNGDRKLDMVAGADNSRVISIYINNTTTDTFSFKPRVDGFTGWEPMEIAIGDLNGDNKNEMVVANAGSDYINVWHNTSTGTNTSFTNFPIHLANGLGDFRGIAVHDMNGDNRPDLVFTRSPKNALAILENTGTNNAIAFAPVVEFAAGQSPQNIVINDFDGDGRPEMATCNGFSNVILVFRNTSNEATVKAAGANPVSGAITQSVKIDASVQTLNGTPYVQRHYDIVPANNPSGSTATVTLYFSQTDFDSLNAHPGRVADLPKNPTDAGGIANLRVYQYHGFSASGLPGSYSDTVEVINPDDNKVVWDTAALCWKISFDVKGFSGFFVSNAGFAWKQVAAPAISAATNTSFCEGGNVVLTSSIAANNKWYKDGVLIPGASGVTYQASASGSYTVKATVDEIISPASAAMLVEVKPVPAAPTITRNGAELVSSAPSGNQWYLDGTLIAGANGSVYRPTQSGIYSAVVTVNGCASLASANFNFNITGVINIDATHYIRLGPNPVDNRLLLDFDVAGYANLNIQVMDMQGRVVGNYLNLSSNSQVILGGLKAGVYVARIYSRNGRLDYSLLFMKK